MSRHICVATTRLLFVMIGLAQSFQAERATIVNLIILVVILLILFGGAWLLLRWPVYGRRPWNGAPDYPRGLVVTRMISAVPLPTPKGLRGARDGNAWVGRKPHR
jgi:NhaP-type Na+/H+ or K+/H+ antiporter